MLCFNKSAHTLPFGLPPVQSVGKSEVAKLALKAKDFLSTTKRRKRKAAKRAAKARDMSLRYLSSFPGPDNAATDRIIHSLARQLLRDEKLSNYELNELREALTYRIEVTELATEYKSFLKLDFPDYSHFYTIE